MASIINTWQQRAEKSKLKKEEKEAKKKAKKESKAAQEETKRQALKPTKAQEQHKTDLQAWRTVCTLTSLVKHDQRFQLLAQKKSSKSKLTNKEKVALAMCSSLSTIAVMEHEVVAVGANYEDPNLITTDIPTNLPSDTDSDDEEVDEEEDEGLKLLPHVTTDFLNFLVTQNVRDTSTTEYPTLESPKMPEALHKRGHLQGDSVTDDIFDEYLSSIRAEGLVLL
jgi:hypothetical protein